MMKRLIYIGLLLLAISIVSYYAIFSTIVGPGSQALGRNVTRVYDNYTLSGNSINVFSFNSTPGNASIYLERSNVPLDVILLNGSGYGLWRAEANSSATAKAYLSLAESLEGKGAVIIYSNVTNATIPLTFSKPVYTQNESNLSLGILGAGRFYILSAISQSPTVGDATVKSTLAGDISLGSTTGVLSEVSNAGIAVTITLIAGLVIILIGIMKQDKKKQGEDIKQEAVDKLYSGIKNSSSEDFAARSPRHKERKKEHGRGK